jgi:N-hydroxyarylamine O-acetyltransferase
MRPLDRRKPGGQNLPEHPDVSSFPLADYLTRIGYANAVTADLVTLKGLHRAHVDAIPFENLEIQMGGAVILAPKTLEAKMVRRRRGGYCFEQNALFAAALRSIGFAVETCEARVRQGMAGTLLPRTHMVLTVRIDGRDLLADVGFGGDGLIEPIPMDGTVHEQAGVPFRVVREASLRLLQRQAAGKWDDLFVVLPDPVYPVDFEMANWFTSTFTRSPFVLNVTAQRITDGTRHILRNLTYTVVRGSESTSREITRAELVPLLRDTFGLDVPEDAKFRALD